MNKIYLLGIGCGYINYIILKIINIIYFSNIVLYDSLINLDFLNYCNIFCKKILIGKRFKKISIFKKTIYFQVFILLKKYFIISKFKCGDVNLYSRINDEIKFLKFNNINYNIISGIASILSCFSNLKFILTYRFIISNILFITYYNNINIFKFKNSFLDKIIIYYMFSGNINHIINFILDMIESFYIFLLESCNLLSEHFFIFNIFDFFIEFIDSFLTLYLPKLLIIGNLFNYVSLNNFIISINNKYF